MNNKLSVGLYGQNGHQIHRKLFDNPEAELIAVCSCSEELIELIKNNCKQDIKVYKTLAEMLEDDSVELISLCSPKRCDQEEDAIACLRAGKHVYAEKPAVFSECGLERILAVAKEMGCEFHETMPRNVEAFIDIESPPVIFNISVSKKCANHTASPPICDIS